ncbi:MAG: helix-turn-helix transcriptional regulator [Rhodothermales bacterium]
METDGYIHFAGDWSEAEREVVERALTEFEREVGDAEPSDGPRPLVCLKVQAGGGPPAFAAYRLGRDDMLAAPTAKELAAKIYRLIVFGTSEGINEEEWRGGIPRARLRDVFDYVRAHLSEPIKVAHIAQRAHLSEAHFAREFKRTLGETPLEYVTRCRVEQAQRLLRHSELHVGEIARRVGLRNASHFAKTFRERVGMTPSQYRRGVIASHVTD